jgi:hypothetical protein
MGTLAQLPEDVLQLNPYRVFISYDRTTEIGDQRICNHPSKKIKLKFYRIHQLLQNRLLDDFEKTDEEGNSIQS